jgi:DNA-binding NarL/FixJ family response regulator
LGLTPSEHEVLLLIARGLDNGAIAAALSKSEKTVRNQVTSIFAKLRVSSRAQAVALARDAGIGDAR